MVRKNSWFNITFEKPKPLIFNPAKKYAIEVKIAKQAVVLISFVGAASSQMEFQLISMELMLRYI